MGNPILARSATPGCWTVIHDGLPVGTVSTVTTPLVTGGERTVWVVYDAGRDVDITAVERGRWDGPQGAVAAVLRARAAHERRAAALPEGLTERDRDILEFERAFGFWEHRARMREVRRRFDLSEWRYLQILNGMVNSDRPVYRAYAPDVIGRLERLRDYQLSKGGSAHHGVLSARRGEERIA